MIDLAIRYLFSRRRQSILTLLGIFLGSAGYVTISGFFLGFQGYIVEELVNNSAHVFVQARQEFLTHDSLNKPFFEKVFDYVFWASAPAGRKDYARVEKPQEWYKRLEADPHVVAYSPQMVVAALATKAKASVPVTLTGCMPEHQLLVNTIAKNIVAGRFTDIGAGGNRLVIGQEVVKQLGVKLSEYINVSIGNNAPAPFKIVGIFDSGNKATDLRAYGALADVQKANQALNQVNEIDIRLADYETASKMSDTWSLLSAEKIESWDQRYSNIFSMFTLQNTLRYLVVTVILLVSGFGIYNVLMMTVSQKLKDIAILQAMGYSSGEVKRLFLYQGLILGVTGAILGLIVGYFACRYLQTLTFSGPPGSTRVTHIHISLKPQIYALGGILAVASAVIASYLPARSASRMTPIEIIRAGVE